MKTAFIHIAIIVSVAGAGVMAYEAYDFLPQEWRDWLTDKKTKAISAFGFFIPDAMTFLGSIQDLGLEDWVPSIWVNLFTKALMALTFISRLQSFWDTREDAKGQS